MNTTSWILWGLGLTCAAAVVHGAVPEASEPMAAMYGAMPALLIGAVGQYCLWRGLRSAFGDLWGGLGAKKSRTANSDKASRGESRFGAGGDQISDFDADAAFARYMEQRAAQEPVVAEDPPRVPVQVPPAAPRHRPAAGGFGRKVV